MIKAIATHEEGKIIFFGLSEMNIRRLKEGKPIKTAVPDFPGVDVVIFYGATEEIMETELSKLGLITEETRRCEFTTQTPNSNSSPKPSAESDSP